MWKRRILITLLLFAALSLGASIRPYLQLSPYFLFDSNPILYTSRPSGGDKGFRKMLDGVSISDSYETIQDTILRINRRPEVAAAGFEIEDGDIFFAIKVEIREELYNALSFSPLSNIPYLGNTKYAITDAQYPQVAFLEYSSDKFLFSIGRRKLDSAPGEYSFMLSSEAQPNLDSIVFGTSYREGKFSLDYYFYAISGSNSTLTGYGKETTLMKNFFIHKVGVGNDVFRFALSEMNCVYGAAPGIYDFTPFVLWHNLYQEEHSNVMIELSLEGKVGPVRLWGLYAQDDIYLNFGGITEGGFNNKPSGLGFGLGFDWILLDGDGYREARKDSESYALREKNLSSSSGIHIKGEFYWATNYLYNRRDSYKIDGTSELGFVNDSLGKLTLPYRFYSSNGGITDKKDAFFLGFPYGPGSILYRLSLEGEGKRIKYGASASLLLRGDATIDTPIDGSTKDTAFALIGDKKKIWSLDISLRYSIMKGLEVNGDVTLQYDQYYDSFTPIVALGVVKVF